MTLYVGFTLKIDAIFIAEIIKVRIVRIVGSSDVVDVGLLHEHNLMFHLFTRNHLTSQRICVVTINAFELQSLTIDVVISACQAEFVLLSRSIFDFNCAETCLETDGLHHLFALHQFTHQHINIRFFGCPWRHMVDRNGLAQLTVSIAIAGGLSIFVIESGHQLVVITKHLVFIKTPTDR